MKNPELERIAHRFADLTRELKGAKRRVSEAERSLANLRSERDKLRTEMAKYVGPNSLRRVVTTPAGIVTLSHDSAKPDPVVSVFDEQGEEIGV